MVFVRRNSGGRIVAVSSEAAEGFGEQLATDDDAISGFLGQLQVTNRDAGGALQATDQGFIRVLEDLIELLDEKGLISLADLPEDARDKVLERQRLRRQLRGGTGDR